MYGIDLSLQFHNLMPALGLGFLLGLFYDVIRIMRINISKGKVFVFVTDVLFAVVCSLTSFLLVLGVNFGHIRAYLIIAEILGYAVYMSTAGVLVFGIAEKISEAFRKIICIIFKPFILIFRRIIRIFSKLFNKIGNKLKKIKIN